MALYIRGEKRLDAKTIAFLYCWTHVTTGMWYVGSRTAPGCHPEDGYICSSKLVKELITKNKSEWNRKILAVGEPSYILNLETNYLTYHDAKNNSLSYNRHNGDGKFTSTGIIATDKTKLKMSNNRKGKSKSDDHKQSISKSLIGLSKTKEHKNSISEGQSIGCYMFKDQMFNTSRKAAEFFGVSNTSILKWSKNNINGWTFKPKESI